jgi:hypothetical protein
MTKDYIDGMARFAMLNGKVIPAINVLEDEVARMKDLKSKAEEMEFMCKDTREDLYDRVSLLPQDTPGCGLQRYRCIFTPVV